MSEMHWQKGNIPKKEKMIKYLSSKNALDVIVVERSYAFGHWINYYLETGDTLLLKEFLSLDNFLVLKNGVLYEDELGFYKWLRKFNLENNKTIKVVGVDLAVFWEGKLTLWSFLKMMEQQPEIAEKLQKNIVEVKKIMLKEKIRKADVKLWQKNLAALVVEKEIKNESILDYVYNLQQSVKWATGNKINYREREIAKNFKRYIKTGEKVYGQYGIGHVFLEPADRISFTSFTSILNKETRYAGRILAINLLCFDCDTFNHFPGEDIYPTYLTKKESEKFKPMFLKLPHNTIVDFRGTSKRIEKYTQLLLIEHH
jgi:hypothetical protein